MARFRGVKRIHFVGIGGIGMCGLAELLLAQGYAVSGTDLVSGATVERLRRLGASVAIGHDAQHVGDADVVVVSSAVRRNNPELLAAEQRAIPVIPRAEMLAEVMRLKDGIAVAGTHGKTTTTSLIAHILQVAGLDPTVVVGGRVMGSLTTAQRSVAAREAASSPAPAQTAQAARSEPKPSEESQRTGARLGQGAFLVAEADESDGSFLHLSPVVAVITNVEPEHLDHYGTAEAMEAAFAAFANRLPFWGRAVLCIDSPGVQRLLPRIARRRTTYGFSAQADWTAHEVARDGAGSRFSVKRAGEVLGTARLAIPGRHNVANALAALAVAAEVEVPFAQAAAALASFAGVERRFEDKGTVRGVRVVDDYGHHPTEVRATLAAAREQHAGRLVVVFQPHRYTRTRDLFDDFAAAFHDADVLVLTEIYAAGEPKLAGVEAAALAEAVRQRGHRDVRFIAEQGAIAPALASELRDGDLVLTLGAGSITRLGPQLLAELERRP
ncbi:MAG: UDP-N-acetylmuramate--L-alanine ligase [Deltaproteobacteria bacterium]|nr:UDP-N-acetylmuramate--L-alanine ligase [Deltaproteobacteria bacterium]